MEYGADVNATNNHGVTPLHLAASDGNADAIIRFLEYGVDIHVRDKNHKTPIQIACEAGHDECVKILARVQMPIQFEPIFY